jgi:hypothetical protein
LFFHPIIQAEAVAVMMGKTQTVTDKLLMHISSATSRQVVYSEVCLLQDMPRPLPVT